jgi:hypothetical protein
MSYYGGFIMTHSFKKYLFLSLICIFSYTHLHSAWWFYSSHELTQPYLPSITKALDREFDRILAPSEQEEVMRTAIEKLKAERIPQILQEAEYEHASQAFINTAQLFRYSFDLVRAACLDFFAQVVYNRCTESMFKNPPCSPDFMSPESIREGVVNYLYDKALTTLTSSKKASLKELLQNLDDEIDYAIRLAIRFGSPLYAVHY